MNKKCDFCSKESRGETTIDNRWTFRNCGSWECKRKQTIVVKVLMNDLSDKTILAIARTIPDKELYPNKPEVDKSQPLNVKQEGGRLSSHA